MDCETVSVQVNRGRRIIPSNCVKHVNKPLATDDVGQLGDNDCSKSSGIFLSDVGNEVHSND